MLLRSAFSTPIATGCSPRTSDSRAFSILLAHRHHNRQASITLPFPDRRKLDLLRSMLKKGMVNEDGTINNSGVLPMGEARNDVLQLLLFQPTTLREDRIQNKEALKNQITDAFVINHEGSPSCARETALLSEAMGWLEQNYGDSLRKDGKTLSVCHAFSLARDIAVCGGSLGAVFLGLFHDLREDYRDRKVRTCEIPRQFNLKIDGRRLSLLVQQITYNPMLHLRHNMDEYRAYLSRLYSAFGPSIGLLLILAKSFDGLENAKTIFDGMPEEERIRHIYKAKIHAGVWKKLNCDVYSYMACLLRAKGAQIEDLFNPSDHQEEAIQSGLRVVKGRDLANWSLFESLPNDGSNVIIEYEPQALELNSQNEKKNKNN